MNGSGPLWVQGAGDQAALRDWGKLVGGGFVSPCMERSHDLAGVFLPERDDFCRSCPVGPDVNQACLVCSVRDQGCWRGALGARLAFETAGDPLLWILFASLADDLGQALSRWQVEHERAELRRQLATSQRLETVGRLAGGVAHDFNNVLTVIMSSCSLVRERTGGDAELLEDLDAIEQGARSASDLVRQLLAFSRRQLLEPRDVDINELLGKTEKMLRRLIGEDIELALVTFSQPVVVHVDPSQLEQVIVNLAVNARDAMPRGGRLLLETGRVELDDDYAATHAGVEPGPYALLTVTDSGSGMDQSTMARIFEPFFTTKEQGRGSGLGLATVYGIVKQSGGHIMVDSESGVGTTFSIYLPEVEGEPEPETAKSKGASRKKAQTTKPDSTEKKARAGAKKTAAKAKKDKAEAVEEKTKPAGKKAEAKEADARLIKKAASKKAPAEEKPAETDSGTNEEKKQDE